MRRKLAAGNWKMNGTSAALAELEALAQTHATATVDVLICPPAPLLHRASETVSGSAVQVGGQDCHANPSGAHTGDISAEMLRDAGATYVILGHSERREDHDETDATIRAKAIAGEKENLKTIICAGESLSQREAGDTLSVIASQLSGSIPDSAPSTGLIVAYEPIWAIGTGLTPSLEQIAEVHDLMRKTLADRFGAAFADDVPLLYGGSVKPSNAAEIFAVSNVDGALVGGASLKAQDFSQIIKALEAA